jgi:hypothetical protein
VEVVKGLFEIAVVARSRAGTGHVPDDVLAQKRPQLGVLSARVEAALCVMEATKQADCRPCGPSGHVIVVAGVASRYIECYRDAVFTGRRVQRCTTTEDTAAGAASRIETVPFVVSDAAAAGSSVAMFALPP